MVVKAGAPLPAIHSADQLRATLLAAPSVAYSDSASGRYVSSTLFHTLGIDDAMQSKAQMVERIPVASEVAKGRYAIGFQQVSELLPVPGVTFVGELPDNLQYITRFCRGGDHQRRPPAGRQGAAGVSSLTGGAGDHPRHRHAKRGRHHAGQPEGYCSIISFSSSAAT